jgi:A-factor biosynthesis hotdog domain
VPVVEHDVVIPSPPETVVEYLSDPGERSFTVLVDTGNPHFSDHPRDHVPGLLLIEAGRQSAIALGSHLLVAEPDELLTVRCATSVHTCAELGTAPRRPGRPWTASRTAARFRAASATTRRGARR